MVSNVSRLFLLVLCGPREKKKSRGFQGRYNLSLCLAVRATNRITNSFLVRFVIEH